LQRSGMKLFAWNCAAVGNCLTRRSLLRRLNSCAPASIAPYESTKILEGRMSDMGPACVKTALDDMILLRFGRRIR
jgi:hypothetical protein